MKALLLMFFFLFPALAFSQNSQYQNGTFLRIYDLNGDKFEKGRIMSITDSSLNVGSAYKIKSIPIKNISIIKTKHSGGHLPLVLGAIGFAIGAGTAAVTYDDTFFGKGTEMIGTGIVIGAGSSFIGLVISLVKKYGIYNVDGDPNKLRKAIYEIEKMEDLEVNSNKEGTTKKSYKSLSENF